MPQFQQIYGLMLELAAAMDRAQIPHALIGGMALGARGYPRGTKDVDFLILEEAVGDLHRIMEQFGAKVIVEGEEFSSYVTPTSIRVDFQHARREISRSMLVRAEPVSFPEGNIPVILAEDLIGLKVQAYHNNPARLQDRVDIHQLISANWGKIDISRVRRYFALFGREHDLNDILRLVAASRR